MNPNRTTLCLFSMLWAILSSTSSTHKVYKSLHQNLSHFGGKGEGQRGGWGRYLRSCPCVNHLYLTWLLINLACETEATPAPPSPHRSGCLLSLLSVYVEFHISSPNCSLYTNQLSFMTSRLQWHPLNSPKSRSTCNYHSTTLRKRQKIQFTIIYEIFKTVW